MNTHQVLRIFSNDYRGQHTAPNSEDSPLWDVTLNETYPKDFYDSPAKAVHYYGGGSEYDAECVNLIFQYHNRPNLAVTIYRAVPDENIEVSKQVKELSALLNYYYKHKFFPVGSEIIHQLADKYPIEQFEYNDQQQRVLQDLTKELQELKSTKKPALKLTPGDWVTISKNYAIDHGRDNLKKYRILSKTVPAKTLYTAGDSVQEWGYNP